MFTYRSIDRLIVRSFNKWNRTIFPFDKWTKKFPSSLTFIFCSPVFFSSVCCTNTTAHHQLLSYCNTTSAQRSNCWMKFNAVCKLAQFSQFDSSTLGNWHQTTIGAYIFGAYAPFPYSIWIVFFVHLSFLPMACSLLANV